MLAYAAKAIGKLERLLESRNDCYFLDMRLSFTLTSITSSTTTSTTFFGESCLSTSELLVGLGRIDHFCSVDAVCTALFCCVALLVLSRFARFARIFVDCSSGCDSVLCSNTDLDSYMLALRLHLELFVPPFSDNYHGAGVLVAMNAIHLCRLLSWCPSQALHLRRFQCSCRSVCTAWFLCSCVSACSRKCCVSRSH